MILTEVRKKQRDRELATFTEVFKNNCDLAKISRATLKATVVRTMSRAEEGIA